MTIISQNGYGYPYLMEASHMQHLSTDNKLLNKQVFMNFMEGNLNSSSQT